MDGAVNKTAENEGTDTVYRAQALAGASVLIPIEHEGVGAFIARAKTVLADPNAHIYVDTSLAMWLTAIGPTSRDCFFRWSETLGDRIHVPTWTLQEYFRHHKRKTQVNAIIEKCSEAEKALNAMGSHMRVYADGALVPDQPEMAFLQELADASDTVARAIRLAKGWDYDSAATPVIEWLNKHALTTTKAFAAFAELGRRGGLRYSHDVPPGFEDRRKKRNRYGDLLFWEDVVEDVRERKAAVGIILTRDRKSDWFFSSVEPEPDDEWKHLGGRWNPVPVPHPLLTAEMKAAAKAELLLIDDLYLGAVMWSTDKAKFGRLAAVSFKMTLSRLEAELAPPASARDRALRRAASETIPLKMALEIVRGAKAAVASEQVSGILASLEGEAPDIEAAIDAITPEWIAALPAADLAVLSRKLYDAGQDAPSAAHAMGSRLLECVDASDAEHASAIVVGMLVGAYYDGETPRERPAGALLQAVFEWRIDAGVARALAALKRELTKQGSPAIFMPSASRLPISLQFAGSQSVVATPAALGQIFVGTQPILVDPVTDPGRALQLLLGGASETDIARLIDLVATYYGIPHDLLETGTAGDETRTIMATSAFERFGPLNQPVRPSAEIAAAGAENIDDADEQPAPPGENGLPAGAAEDADGDDAAGAADEDDLLEASEDDLDDYEDEDEDDLI